MARIKPQALLQQSKRKKGPNRISIVTFVMFGLIIGSAFYLMNFAYRHWSRRSDLQVENHESLLESDDSFMDLKKSEVPGYAIIRTPKGFITIELFKDSSPEIVDEFIDLCQKAQFNGMLFRRVIKHYVIQAGNTDELEDMDDWTTRGKYYAQLDTRLKHEAFMLGTSKVKHDTRAFDLFITTAPIPDLNEKLIVFGRVVKGEDVVQEIEEVDTDEHFQPQSSIGINSLTLKQRI